ncbi:acetate--CoA ligase, partial [Streptococcus pyogenes]
VAATYLGAVPVMVSFHFPSEVIRVFAERLENPFIIYDEGTKAVVDAVDTIDENHKIEVSKLLAAPSDFVGPASLSEDQ